MPSVAPLSTLIQPAGNRITGENPFKKGMVGNSPSLVRLILTEDEKYADDKAAVKNIFRYYEAIGLTQVRRKVREVRKLYNLAYGRIDVEDYIEMDAEFAPAAGMNPLTHEELSHVKLSFYPIIPTLFRGITGSYDKIYTEFNASAVNPEVTNDILDKMNEDLRNALVSNTEQLFLMAEAGQPVDVIEQKHQLLMQSQQVQSYYGSEYRPTIEEWAQHTMNLEDLQFAIKSIEGLLVEQQVVTGDPTVHIDFNGHSYKPVVLKEKDTFYLKSPRSQDYSESLMFGWFEDLTLAEIMNEYGTKISTENIEKLSQWSFTMQGETFSINNMLPSYNPNERLWQSRNNYLTADEVVRNHRVKDAINRDGIGPECVRLATIYFYIPRKYGELTVKNGDDPIIKEIVDETFKVTIKPVYEKGMPHTADYLISGEHVDWFYRPELWRGKKISTVGVAPGALLNTQDQNEIWIELDRFEIQYEDPFNQYGVYIPVHGGPITNQFNDTTSVVKQASSWQIQYNWIINRNEQLLSGEIGKFFATPETNIPNQSLEGEWGGQDALSQFTMSARDNGIVAMSNGSSVNGGPNPANMANGQGQVIDLTNTQDIINKFTLANMIEAACYRSVGLTPEFLLGDYSPEQSAKSAAMGQQRTATQLQNVYKRVSQVAIKMRTTMLAAAQYLAAKKPTVEMSYTTNQQARILFQTSTELFPLARLGVFVKSNSADLTVIESIKQYVSQNNTMGANSYEMAVLMSFRSLPELFKKLQDIQARKDADMEKQHQQQMELQQAQLEAQNAQKQAELAAKAEESALDREASIMRAQIAAVGYANGTPEEIQKAIMDLQNATQVNKDLYDRFNMDQAKIQADAAQQQAQMDHQKQNSDFQRRVELKKLQQKDTELQLRGKQIEASKQRTKAIDN